MSRLLLRSTYVIGSAGFYSNIALKNTAFNEQNQSITTEDKIVAISQRFKISLLEENRRFLRQRGGVKIFYPKTGNLGRKSMPIVRIAEVEINAPLDTVRCKLQDHENMKEWDKTLADCQKIEKIGAPPILYLRKNSQYFLPERDFAGNVHQLPGGLLGINDYRVVVFITADNADGVDHSWRAVRGNCNSILVLQPAGFNKTNLTQIIELNPGGWIPNWLGVADFLSGDSTIKQLQYLKKSIEDLEEEESTSMSVEEIARKRVAKRLEKETATKVSIVDDMSVSKEDLNATVAMLERRLAELSRSEKAQGLDLSELKRRAQADLKTASDRLKAMK